MPVIEWLCFVKPWCARSSLSHVLPQARRDVVIDINGEVESCLPSGLEIEAALRRLFDVALAISFEGIYNSAIGRKGL